MSVKTISSLNKTNNNNNLEASITKEEMREAEGLLKEVAVDGSDSKNPIFPVPDDAPEFNFYIQNYGGKPTNKWAYHNASGKLLGYIARWDVDEKSLKSKKILPICFCKMLDGSRKWKSAGIPEPRPLYKLPEILSKLDITILVNEGESSADAGQILFPKYVSTTPMHGALSPHKTEWSAVKSRDVIIAPDFDEAGNIFANSVFDLCIKAGAKSIMCLDIEEIGKYIVVDGNPISRSEPTPKGYDLADALKDGWTAEILSGFGSKFIVSYIRKPTINELNESVANGFRLTENGVEYKEQITKNGSISEEWHWFCSCLAITHQTRDEKSENWGRVLVLIDNDGKSKEFVLPMSDFAGDGVAYREQLFSRGLILAPKKEKLLHSYITTTLTKQRATCVSKVGWYNKCFVLPNKIIGDSNNEKLVLQTNSKIQAFNVKGTLLQWQEKVGKLAIGNNRLIFIISLALTAPLLKLLNEENFGIHLYGGSSTGKTTALYVAQSVWGNQVNSWRTTDNAAESMARNSNDALLILDELSQVDSFSADAMTYMFGNGSGKARAKRDGGAKPVEKFRTVFLSSGEITFTSKMQEVNRKVKAGQTVRFIEVPADSGVGLGLFENIHNYSDSNIFSITLKTMTTECQGTAIEAFLKLLCANSEKITRRIANESKYWVDKYLPKNADGQVARVAHKFSLIAAAGELGIALGILPWEQETANNACKIMFDCWLRHRGGAQAYELIEVVNRLRSFIAQHGNSRFEAAWGNEFVDNNVIPQEKRTLQRVGFRKLNESNEWEYYIIQSMFEKEVICCKATSQIKAYLAEAGLIKRDSEGKCTISINVPGYGQGRYYFIPSSLILKGDDYENK
jgi:uncharacterized protein (DUF927 family)